MCNSLNDYGEILTQGGAEMRKKKYINQQKIIISTLSRVFLLK
ncbi:hypothetical protein X798_06286 [Onchocerca flexuosa]|uniref:Uncharacterized protein n=1 Tax=Onchocerca flexuosa TaxID=387005 RepID=A0A238BPC5_9BILA|nr:hypothetical protein X798_06286 [Onchocerca flexuosa]